MKRILLSFVMVFGMMLSSTTFTNAAPEALSFNFNPIWDSSVLENKVVYSKYSLGDTTSMVVGFPTKIRNSGECATVVFHLAPVDYLKKESPASADFKKYAAFSIDIWTKDGLKLATLDSRDSTNFFAPTLITQVPIKLCDKVFSSGREIGLKLAFKTGVSIVYGDIVEFNENLLVVGNPVINNSDSKKTTITCVKGKLTKKVAAIKPKCPAGYKLKK